MKIQLFELDLTDEEKKFWRPKFRNFFLINDKKIFVPEDIWKVEVIDDICFVNFRSDSKQKCMEKGYTGTRNIWAFNEKGEKLWEIEDANESLIHQRILEGYPREKFYEEDGITSKAYTPYTGFNIGKQQHVGKIFVTTSSNFTAELDIKTGKVFDWIQGK